MITIYLKGIYNIAVFFLLITIEQEILYSSPVGEIQSQSLYAVIFYGYCCLCIIILLIISSRSGLRTEPPFYISYFSFFESLALMLLSSLGSKCALLLYFFLLLWQLFYSFIVSQHLSYYSIMLRKKFFSHENVGSVFAHFLPISSASNVV